MNIDELTLGQIKEIQKLISNDHPPFRFIGSDVIIRTYSAGCWFGRLEQKDGNEVILSGARRLWRWWAAGDSISLSGVAIHGVIYEKSKIVESVPAIWLEAIEIAPCTDKAAKSLREAPDVQAE